MAYPTTIDTYTPVAGTSLFTATDHSNKHNVIGSAIITVETTLGTTGGTSIAKNFVAGDFPIRMNSGGTIQDTIVKGTLNNITLGSPTTTGGTTTGALFTGGTITTGTFTGTITNGNVITGGTINSFTMGTPTILGGTIAISGTVVPLSIGAGLVPTMGTYADSAGGTITINTQQGNMFRITLGTTAGNRTIGTPLNPTADQAITIAFKNNSGATGTLVWASVFRVSELGTPTLGSASTWNYYGWRYNGADSKFDFQGQTKNLV